MGRIVVSEFVSVDGYYADDTGGLDWVTADDEHHNYSIALLEDTALLLFGRATWEIFQAYWPRIGGDPGAPQHELAVGALLDRIPKVVFSSTLSTDEWLTTVRPTAVAAEIAALRDQADGDVVIFGSGRFVQAIGRLGLIDEYQLLIQPVALGAGLPLFEPGRKVDLVLDRAEPLDSGVVRHFYRPAAGAVRRVNYAS
jgi:dihydrofolate reductase